MDLVGRYAGVLDQLDGDRERPFQGVGMELACCVNTLTWPDDLGLPVEIDQATLGPGLGDQQAERWCRSQRPQPS